MSDLTLGFVLATAVFVFYCWCRVAISPLLLLQELRSLKATLLRRKASQPSSHQSGGIRSGSETEMELWAGRLKDVVRNILTTSVGVSRASIGPSSVPNWAVRVFVLTPTFTYVILFCVAELWNENSIHWFCAFLAVYAMVIIVWEVPTELLALRWLGRKKGEADDPPQAFSGGAWDVARKPFQWAHSIAATLRDALVLAALLSLVGLAAPTHDIDPFEARVVLVALFLVLLLTVLISRGNSGFRVIGLHKPLLLSILLLSILALVLAFGVFELGTDGRSNRSAFGFGSGTSSGLAQPVERSTPAPTPTPAKPQPQPTTTTNQQQQARGPVEVICRDARAERGDRYVQVPLRANCWSEEIVIPRNVSVRTNLPGFEVWAPFKGASNYYVGDRKARHFSCAEIAGKTVIPSKFRARSCDPEGAILRISW